MNYIEVSFTLKPFSNDVADVLASMLSELDFDSFTTEEPVLKAYCPKNKYNTAAVDELLPALPFPGLEITVSSAEVETQDWNSAWEETVKFEPIVIGNECCIHAPGQADVPQCRYDVVIAPKMSFGSGHHETTSQLLGEILQLYKAEPEHYKKVLDMGAGTAVLGILAAQCGAEKVRAIEIDDWVADNARDNVLLNGLASTVLVECGDASLLGNGTFYNLVLANINRNVLLADMAKYVADLNPKGILLMSGFYEEDLPMINSCAEGLGLTFVKSLSRNNWVVAEYRK